MFLEQLKLRNVLSYRELDFKFEPVTAIIGANAAGKSNLLRALELLKAMAVDISRFSWGAGGAKTWIHGLDNGKLSLEAVFPSSAVYQFGVSSVDSAYQVDYEVATILSQGGSSLYFTRDNREATLLLNRPPFPIDVRESVLPRLGLESDPNILQVRKGLEEILFYSEFDLSVRGQLRSGTALPAFKDRLSVKGENLALILSHRQHVRALDPINRYMKRLIPSFEEISVSVEATYAILFFHMAGMVVPVPASRLSDGTLSFLGLLTALLDPQPPPLICLEEPEKGLHPEAVALLGRAILEASEHTQIVLTTHSKDLVDMFSARPEYVVTAEYDPAEGTKLVRHTRDELDVWLDDYSLGDLWVRGQIGGVPQ